MDTSPSQNLSDNVRRARERSGLNQRDFALMVGVSRPIISAIEQGITTREDAAIRYNGSDWYSNVAELARENAALAGSSASGEPSTQSTSNRTEGA